MQFTKMQGCGNDYIYIDGAREKISPEQKPEIARKLSDRHFGIGGDGVIFINPSETADFEMEMYNADGSRGKMCGNGIRCVAKYVYDHQLTEKNQLTIESCQAVKTLYLTVENGKVSRVRVDMGVPVLEAEKIPVIPEKLLECSNSSNEESPGKYSEKIPEDSDKANMLIDALILVNGREEKITAVSMGNPHVVVFTDDVDSLDLEHTGPEFEFHKAFPDRVNTEFVQVTDTEHIKMRVWERGSGETLACGTGACASVVAAVLTGRTQRRVNVQLSGGQLELEWDQQNDHIYMTGPAAEVFTGTADLRSLIGLSAR